MEILCIKQEAVSSLSFKAATSSGITNQECTSDGSSTALSAHRVLENPEQKKRKKEEIKKILGEHIPESFFLI